MLCKLAKANLKTLNADCDECHDRACPVITGFATYDMLVDDDSDEDSDEDSQK